MCLHPAGRRAHAARARARSLQMARLRYRQRLRQLMLEALMATERETERALQEQRLALLAEIRRCTQREGDRLPEADSDPSP